MYNWYLVYRVEMQRRQEEIAQAERYRLAGLGWKHINLRMPALRGTSRRLLVALGTVLVEVGCRLQSRYESLAAGELVDPAVESRARPCAG